ncbi:MAG: hypothetical protein IJ654_09470 [Bacteroidales bacterium]|nr:hypothetical protein [Bacteroidales bacterium]
MEYGLIGEHLGHSFSKEIHGKLSPASYELREVAREALPGFLKEGDFKGINVTIPYKEAVIPYLDGISPEAKAIGAVNTIVRREGRLYGFNSDYFGLAALADRAGIRFEGRQVLILGAGGAAKTVAALARDRGAASITHAVRHPRPDGQRSLSELGPGEPYEIVVNCTPVGMFPGEEETPVDLRYFPRLCGVLDLIYNPLRTNLILDAEALGIPAAGGLYMLVAQAARARDLFDDVPDIVRSLAETPAGMRAPSAAKDRLSAQRMTPDERMDEAPCRRRSTAPSRINDVFDETLRSKRNLVLIGMPSSGKSTVGQHLAARSGRTFLDTDALIIERAGKPIPRIFAEDGEAAFRRIESEVIRALSVRNGLILATGGGAVLDPDNVRRLRRNGLLCRIDRDLERLTPTEDRPLARDPLALKALYEQRKNAYARATDVVLDNNGPLENALQQAKALI